MSVVAFAEAMDVNYTTVIRWLRSGLAPGARRIEPVPGMSVWRIPESALQMKLPKPGTKTTGVKISKKGRFQVANAYPL